MHYILSNIFINSKSIRPNTKTILNQNYNTVRNTLGQSFSICGAQVSRRELALQNNVRRGYNRNWHSSLLYWVVFIAGTAETAVSQRQVYMGKYNFDLLVFNSIVLTNSFTLVNIFIFFASNLSFLILVFYIKRLLCYLCLRIMY